MAPTTEFERHGIGPTDGGRVTLEELERNPYPIYRALQEQGVVWVDAVQRWLVTRWLDVDRVERDSLRISARETDSLQTRVMGRTMMRSDGQEHRRLRAASQLPLSLPVVERHWLPAFSEIVGELLDDLSQRHRADMMSEFCAPLAARCLRLVLGMRDVSDGVLQRWSQAMLDGQANYGDDPEVWQSCQCAVDEIADAVSDAMDRVRRHPDESLVSAMVHATGDGALSDEEIKSNVMLIIGGGLNEPRDGLGITLWALLTHPDERDRALAHPVRWPRIVDEALRWISPLAMFMREVVAPVQIDRTRLQPGARLGLVVAAANRDERHWADPDRFNVDRPKSRNVAFGVGSHFCLGVWMSRYLIGDAALPALFSRLSHLRLDLDQPPDFRGWVFRGPTRLHARWDPCR
jgi:cytochrome P450